MNQSHYQDLRYLPPEELIINERIYYDSFETTAFTIESHALHSPQTLPS